jgi:hypothetical protein
MPAAFDKCVKSGGKVITKKLSGGRYMKLCKKGKKWHAGHIKKK